MCFDPAPWESDGRLWKATTWLGLNQLRYIESAASAIRRKSPTEVEMIPKMISYLVGFQIDRQVGTRCDLGSVRVLLLDPATLLKSGGTYRPKITTRKDGALVTAKAPKYGNPYDKTLLRARHSRLDLEVVLTETKSLLKQCLKAVGHFCSFPLHVLSNILVADNAGRGEGHL